jgi:hypothetical protein
LEDDKKLALVSQIRSAFKDVPYPGDHAITLMGDAAVGEQSSIAESLKGKSWEQLNNEAIRWHHASSQLD